MVVFISLQNSELKANETPDSLLAIFKDANQSDSIRYAAVFEFYVKFANSLPDSSLIISNAHYTLAKKTKNYHEMAKALNEKAFAQFILGQYDNTFKTLGEALKIRQAENDTIGEALLLSNIGSLYREVENYQEAINCYSKSFEILNSKNAKLSHQADLLHNLGLIYIDISMNDVGLKYLNQALALYEKENLLEETGNIWINIGAVYSENNDYITAKRYFDKAFKVLEFTKNTLSYSVYYQEKAKLFAQQNEIDSAISYINKSIAIEIEFNNTEKILSGKILKAKLLLEKDFEAAHVLILEVFSKLDFISNKSTKSTTYNLMYNCQKRLGDYKSALKMLEKYNMYNDSILADKDKISIVRQAIQSQYESKMLQLKIDAEKQQADLKLTQLKRIYLILFVGVLVLISFFWVARSRTLKHKKEKEMLLQALETEKSKAKSTVALQSQDINLNRTQIEKNIGKELNETDWKVLNLLLEDPTMPNKTIAEKAFMSIDGIGSSLRRMYATFQVAESKYMKIALLTQAIKFSSTKE